MESGETRAITCSSGVQQGDPMGPAMSCLASRPGLKLFREEFDGEGVEAFAYMDDVSLGLMGVTANTAREALPSSGESYKTLALWLTPLRPWNYHRKGTPRRRRKFRSLKALMSASWATEE